MKTVFVGLSGGVDSSVSAALIKEQGYKVVGVYMKNWSQDLPGFACPWKQDYQDAKRVAVQLGIEFEMFDFETEYKSKVVDYMIDEFKAGRTPNPDIMCNQEIKFKLFLDTSLEKGANYIATGHYAQIRDGQLLKGLDTNKDQSYFLYRINQNAISHTNFPIGELKKPQVRELAIKYRLATATKKESMGICFVGKVGIKEFLQNYVQTQPGAIIEQNGIEIGQHEGAIFYTVGQRHGLSVGGGLPYYVVGKDMQKNEVYVTTNIDDDRLWHESIKITDLHWINEPPIADKTYQIRCRYRAPLVNCNFKDNTLKSIKLQDPVKAVTVGQSAVVYDGECVVGGGIII